METFEDFVEDEKLNFQNQFQGLSDCEIRGVAAARVLDGFNTLPDATDYAQSLLNHNVILYDVYGYPITAEAILGAVEFCTDHGYTLKDL